MRYIILILLNCTFALSAGIDINFKDVYFNSYAYSESGRNLAVFDTTNTLSIVNLDEKRVISSIKTDFNKITALYFEDQVLYAGFEDGYIVKFDDRFSSYSEVIKSSNIKPKNTITNLHIANKLLYAISNKNEFIIYDMERNILQILDDLKKLSKVTTLAITNNSAYISCWDRSVYKLNLKDKTLQELSKLPARALSSKLIKDKNSLLLGLEDGSVLDLNDNKLHQISKKQIDSIALEKDKIYFGDGEGSIIQSDTNFKIQQKFKLFNDRVRALFFDKDAGIFGLSWDGHIRTISNKK